MPLNKEQLTDDLKNHCNVVPGETLIVHASARSVGAIQGGAAMIAEALQNAVTTKGTILAPTFSHPQPDGIFRMDATPSRVGYVTECLRLNPRSVRSQHPTHSVTAWGRRANEFTAGHKYTSALGPDSPLHKATKAGATILMIGCDLTACSLVHVAEAMVRPPFFGKVTYPGYDVVLTLEDTKGNRHRVSPADLPGDSKGFTVVQHELERRGAIHHGRLGNAETLCFDAMTCLETACQLLEAYPAALLCENPNCTVCSESKRILTESARTLSH